MKYLTAFLGLMFICTNLFADDLPADVRVPVIVISTGNNYDVDSINKIVEDLGAPVIRGEQMAAALNITMDSNVDLSDDFEAAKDKFFSGRTEKARTFFKKIILSTKDTLWTRSSQNTRKIVFESMIYLAVIAKSENDENVDELLERAAERFAGQSPSVEFPPWVRDDFKALRSKKEAVGRITLEAPEGCDLSLLGSQTEDDLGLEGLMPGKYAVKLSCTDGYVLNGVVAVDGDVTFNPFILKHTRLSNKENLLDFQLTAIDAKPNQIVEDVLSVARAGGWTRIVTIVETDSSKPKVWLVDVETGGIVRSLSTSDDPEQETITATEPVIATSPWYKKPVAWTLFTVGAAMLTTGIILNVKNPAPSKIEPLALSFIAGGAGLTCTGGVLFFIPRYESVPGSKKNLSMGLATSFTF